MLGFRWHAGLIGRNMGRLRAGQSGFIMSKAKSTNKPAAPVRPKPLRRRGAARVIDEAPRGAASLADDEATFVEHPDGWYWVAPAGHQEFGPFASRSDARADRDRYNEEAPVEGETVQEAEREIGIADWIDAETGAPAEGQSPPHLEE
jgi:hypothetical protein